VLIILMMVLAPLAPKLVSISVRVDPSDRRRPLLYNWIYSI